MESVGERLDAVARRRPDKPALVWDGGALSWRELDLRAGGFARRLSRRGVRAGDTVALSLPNGWGFVVALWGGLKLGATVAPLNPLLAAEERDKVLAHLTPALVVDDVRAEEAIVDATGGRAPALILYTSGSAGQPKGAVLSQRALAEANDSWAGPVMRLTPEDVVLAALPLAHSFGLNGALLAPLLAGATVVVLARFGPEDAGFLPSGLGLGLRSLAGLLQLVARLLGAAGHGLADALGGVLDALADFLGAALDLLGALLHLGIVLRLGVVGGYRRPRPEQTEHQR